MSYNIAVDGPAGAGKSTIAKAVAKELNIIYVDTGAMYRGMGLYMLRRGIDPEDEQAVTAHCEEADIALQYEDGVQVVCLNGENVNDYIRTEEVGTATSRISAFPGLYYGRSGHRYLRAAGRGRKNISYRQQCSPRQTSL